MAKLIYSVLMPLDGYTADNAGNFDWAEPDEEVHSLINELERPVDTYLYGRRMYDVMSVWETMPTDDQPAYMAEYAAIWRAANKLVYSKTLTTVSTSRTRIEPGFDPEAISRLKASLQSDLSIGGPALAAQAFNAGLIDICQLFIMPIIVGAGIRAFPSDGRLQLTLQDARRFRNGVAFLQYTTAQTQAA